MTLPVALYIPNLLGYARIVLAFVGLHYASANPTWAVVIWIGSAALDFFDGMLARALDQTSSFGVLLDIVADNILRTTTWMAVVTADPNYCLVACLIISLEWTTMISTQLHASQSGAHWKTARSQDPWWIQAIFANNFRTPLGILAIYGLFGASLFAYGSYHPEISNKIPYFEAFKRLAFLGRAVTGLAEVWLNLGYWSLVVEQDIAAARERKS